MYANPLHVTDAPDLNGANDEPITWTSQVAFDPGLIERLVASNDRLRAAFARVVEAWQGAPDHVVAAAERCAHELHALNRVEALRLYPVIARQFAGKPAALDAFTRRRLAVYGHGRKLLRFLEAAIAGRRVDAGELRAAVEVLGRYVAEKQAQLYTLYLALGKGAA
jgi:hypothetical protein